MEVYHQKIFHGKTTSNMPSTISGCLTDIYEYYLTKKCPFSDTFLLKSND